MKHITAPLIMLAAALSLQAAGIRLLPRVENTVYLDGTAPNTTVAYTYNTAGRVSQSVTSVLNGDGTAGDPIAKTVNVYDVAHPEICLDNKDYVYRDSAWVQTGGTAVSLTSDADGRITGIYTETYERADQAYLPWQRIAVTYGANSQPSALTVEEYTDGTWAQTQSATNIVWDSYTGVIPDFSDFDNIFSTGSRLKSAVIAVKMDEIDANGTLTVSYPDTLGGFVANYNAKLYGGMVSAKLKITNTVTDSCGSFTRITEQTVSVPFYGNMVAVDKEECTLDRFGLKLREYEETREDGAVTWQSLTVRVPEYAAGEIAVASYEEYKLADNTFDPATVTVEEMNAVKRVSFADYIDPAGVGETFADGDAPVQYYDLRGLPVAEPSAPGLYIRRQGAKVTKVAL